MINEKNGSYVDNSLVHHVFDRKLADALKSFFENEHSERVADFGCGPGWYTNIINRFSKVKCDGYDANPYTINLVKQNNCVGNFYIADLTTNLEINNKYDWVLCLEVGEHIPHTFEDILIQNLHKNNTKGIILSWAVEGQAGPGHVNCKNNDYVKNRFKELNYTNDTVAENYLRNNISTAEWFKNTIMVFRK